MSTVSPVPERIAGLPADSGAVPPRVRAVCWLLGAFLIVAPLSQSGEAGLAMKLLRVTLGLEMLIIGSVYVGAMFRNRLISKWIWFWLLFTVAALWSRYPLIGLLFKGQSLVIFLAGLMAGSVLSSSRDLGYAVRILILASAASAVLLTFAAAGEDLGSQRVYDRLSVKGINSNSIASAAMPIALVCAYAIAAERSLFLRLVAAFAGAYAAWVLLASGSRASVAATLLALIVMFAGMRRERLVLAAAVPLLSVAVWQFLSVDGGLIGVDRMLDRGLTNTRENLWEYVLARWVAENLLFGVGWFSWNGNSWANLLNVGLQVLAETGLIGAAMFFGVLVALLRSALFVYRRRAVLGSQEGLLSLLIAIQLAIAMRGAFEASMMLGTNAHTLLWGFSIAVIGRMEVGIRRMAR